MESFNLKILGIKELDKNSMVEIAGGYINWWPLLNASMELLVRMGDFISREMSQRASQEGYVMYADVSHR